MRKRFYMKIELQLHAITCPGVWLCTSGYMEVTIKTLGYFFKTGALEAKFPALCHDQFVMEGYFKSVGSVSQLERVIRSEDISITLWQNGRRLAHFAGKLADLLQPPFARMSCFHNTNVQVLMNPSQSFPGIISPKLEISVLASIHDNSQRICQHSDTPSHILTSTIPCGSQHKSKKMPNVVSSSDSYDSPLEFRRQKPVCHAKLEKDCGWQRSNSFASSPDFHHLSRSSSSNGSDSRGPISRPHSGEKSSDTFYINRMRNRRTSSCSSSGSRYSSVSSSPSQRKCSHRFSNGYPSDDHGSDCRICQSYNTIFSENI